MDYNKLLERIKEGYDVEGAYMYHMNDFMTKAKITNKKQYKVELALPAEEILNNPKSVPLKKGDYKLVPLLLFLKEKR